MTRMLLPAGCYDLLPPFARQDSALAERLLAVFESFGYAQVAPPFLEFTESLLAGRGAALSTQVFRVMDPGAHKVMGLRADHTMQIARIAATRLSEAPRPLRLSYAGSVLRLRPEGTRGGRQLRQAGIELIGAASAEADVEVIRVAAQALRAAGITHFTIDLNLPALATGLLAEDALGPDEAAGVLSAIAHKDTAALRAMKLQHKNTLAALVGIAAPAEQALAELQHLKLPEELAPAVEALSRVVALLTPLLGDASLTLDPAEARGFEYHTGVTFSLLAQGSAGELGRGGRYRLDSGEEATGATLFVDNIRALLPPPEQGKRVLVMGADEAALEKLHKEGFVTVLALTEFDADATEARRLGCSHVWKSGKLTPV